VKVNKTPAFILNQFGWTAENVDAMITGAGDTLTLKVDKPFAPTFLYNCLTAGVASIVDAETVKTHDVGGDMANVAYRPTVYDLLAHRALEIFRNTETRIAEPAWHFTLKDAQAFALFEDFAHRPFRHRDSTSWEFQAIRLYQDLDRRHLADNTPDALVDNDLQRLTYVHARSTHPRKDTLLLEAYGKLRSRVPKDSCWSEVTVALAQWHRTKADGYQRLVIGRSPRQVALEDRVDAADVPCAVADTADTLSWPITP
jgi:hypothetical protein